MNVGTYHNEYSHSCALEIGPVGDQALVASDTEEKVALGAAVLQMRIVVFRYALLKHLLRLDFEVLELDEGRVGGLTAEVGEYLEALVVAALIHQPAGRLGKKHDADTENDGGEDLDGDGNEPSSATLGLASAADKVGAYSGSATVLLLCRKRFTIGQPVTNHDAKGNSQLLQRDKRSSDLGGRDFGIVKWHNHR